MLRDEFIDFAIAGMFYAGEYAPLPGATFYFAHQLIAGKVMPESMPRFPGPLFILPTNL
jgi:hypothetical protein